MRWIAVGVVFLLIWFKRREEQTEERHRFRERELENRIAELEERLCPCQSHDWKRSISTLREGQAVVMKRPSIPINAPGVARSDGHTRYCPKRIRI